MVWIYSLVVRRYRLNENLLVLGNDVKFPIRPDGSRDLDMSWSHIQTWKQMEKLVGTGKAKAIGVCNYSVKYLEELLIHATVIPAVNQIEGHPYLPQTEVVSFCNTRGIHIMAYSPLGSAGSPLMKEPLVETIAAKHGISSATVLLSYHSLSYPAAVLFPDYMLTLSPADKRGSTVISKSVQVSRIDQNNKMVDLDAEDMEALEIIHKSAGIRRYVYPAFGVDFGFPDKS